MFRRWLEWRRGTGRIREENVNWAWIQGGKCSWLTKRAPGFATKTEGGADVFYERRLLQQEELRKCYKYK